MTPTSYPPKSRFFAIFGPFLAHFGRSGAVCGPKSQIFGHVLDEFVDRSDSFESRSGRKSPQMTPNHRDMAPTSHFDPPPVTPEKCDFWPFLADFGHFRGKLAFWTHFGPKIV